MSKFIVADVLVGGFRQRNLPSTEREQAPAGLVLLLLLPLSAGNGLACPLGACCLGLQMQTAQALFQSVFGVSGLHFCTEREHTIAKVAALVSSAAELSQQTL